MASEHPNISLIKRFNPADLSACAAIFAEDLIWHFFNPHLPDLQGDYVGVEGLKTFFENLARMSDGTFHVEPISINPVGDELVTMHTKNMMTIDGQRIETDVVLVWRIVDGRIKEIWDIPAIQKHVFSIHPQQ